ncbi:Cytochrome P450 [Pseudohyphozyma bogoriensis]|nr:Cytochrome P450 [Pseudohyphozyma bogoriensis]
MIVSHHRGDCISPPIQFINVETLREKLESKTREMQGFLIDVNNFAVQLKAAEESMQRSGPTPEATAHARDLNHAMWHSQTQASILQGEITTLTSLIPSLETHQGPDNAPLPLETSRRLKTMSDDLATKAARLAELQGKVTELSTELERHRKASQDIKKDRSANERIEFVNSLQFQSFSLLH